MLHDCWQLAVAFAVVLKAKMQIADAFIFFIYVLIGFCTSSAKAPHHGPQIATIYRSGFSRATIDTDQSFRTGKLRVSFARPREKQKRVPFSRWSTLPMIVLCWYTVNDGITFLRSECKNRCHCHDMCAYMCARISRKCVNGLQMCRKMKLLEGSKAPIRYHQRNIPALSTEGTPHL